MELTGLIPHIEHFEAVTGLTVLLKNERGGPLVPEYRERGEHLGPVCAALKARPVLLSRCRRDDCRQAMVTARETRKPFLKLCHAGLTETVAPVLVDGEVIGTLLIGPYLLPDSHDNVYPLVADEFADLKVLERDRALAMGYLLFESVNALINGTQQTTQTNLAERDSRVVEARRYIRTHIRWKLPVADIARHCHLSTSRLQHLFKQETGATLKAYLLQEKMAYAGRLLAATVLPLRQIGVLAGYDSYPNFSAAFRKHMGVPPRSYRKVEREKLVP